MNADRRTTWEEGEYEGSDTPDLSALRQKVVGRTARGSDVKGR